MAQNKMLKEKLQTILESVQKYARAIKVLAGAEVAIVVLFQIMPHNTNATREGGRDGGGAAEMEVLRQRVEEEEEEEEEENNTTATSMFGIICAVYGKDTALEIVNNMLNNMHIAAALGYVITEYRKGKVQRECVYYLLRKYHELTLTYRKLIETYIFGNDHPIEAGLNTIFMTLPYYKEYKSSTLFQSACYRLGRNAVVKIIEDTLQQQKHSASSSSSSSSLSSRSSMNTMLALMYAATINDKNNTRRTTTMQQ